MLADYSPLWNTLLTIGCALVLSVIIIFVVAMCKAIKNNVNEIDDDE